MQATVDRFLKDYDLKLNFKYQSDEPVTVRQMIVASLGIGFIPQVTCGISFSNYKQVETAHLDLKIHQTGPFI